MVLYEQLLIGSGCSDSSLWPRVNITESWYLFWLIIVKAKPVALWVQIKQMVLSLFFQRYKEAADAFRDVLKRESSYAEAAQELMRVQIIQLMVRVIHNYIITFSN